MSGQRLVSPQRTRTPACATKGRADRATSALGDGAVLRSVASVRGGRDHAGTQGNTVVSAYCDARADPVRPHGGRGLQAGVLAEDVGITALKPLAGLQAEFLVEPSPEPVVEIQRVA